VYRTSPGTYRVQHGACVADLAVERLDEYERRIVCGGRSYRVLAVTEHAGFRIEVDGKAHQVFRDDGGVVRAGWPAFVVSVLVQPGDDVVENTPIAVLESMKMESTVVAPFAGEVASVAVVANAQVDAGAPLVRIRASGTTAFAVPVTGSVDLSGLAARPAAGTPPCERVFGALRNYLLGYDLDPATRDRLLVEQRRLGELAPPGDAGLLACEDALLDLFAGVPSGVPAVARRRSSRAAGQFRRAPRKGAGPLRRSRSRAYA
jgi:pyruvate/2-oxoglutarate dehydrogenase complex dihydrolipoamide acyltransferase (E2) component